MVVGLADDGLKVEPYNLNLMYLAGFASEMVGKTEKAEAYYKMIISLDENNYEGNYALGLLYLTLYLKAKDNGDLVLRSRKYLVQASEINPNSVNALKSLTILYKNTNNQIELQRVNNKLQQIILN
jgi:tetratricopeptide (TPR) repeat protein